MTEPKFTPGPWQVHHENKVCRVIRDEQLEIIGWCDVNNEANANLIGAVPDMYEALKCACDQYCIGYAGDSIVKCEDCIIDKALRKARGKTE